MNKYYYTIKNLRPIQIRYQITNRLFRNRNKRLLRKFLAYTAPKEIKKIDILIPELDLDKDYLCRFDVDELMNGTVKILHESHNVNEEGWKVQKATHLWNFNLHYLEYLIVLAKKYHETKNDIYYNKWKELVNDWMNNPSDDSYAAYTISLRVVNLLIQMQLLEERLATDDFRQKLYDSIYGQYRLLISIQELSLLANHYFENIKTIVICSVLFGEKKIYRKYIDKLITEINEQILPDGMHYERSFMYHRIILEDILRVYSVIDVETDREKLKAAVIGMSEVIEGFEKDISRIPLFNDAGNNVSKTKEGLVKAANKFVGCTCDNGKKILPNSGYFKIQSENISIIFDCGDIGPSYMGGHAHNDCLSFELYYCGEPVFVNAGTYNYQSKLRGFFRSSAAHNTFRIDNYEQSELWGEHRVARRARNIKCEYGENVLEGSFTSYSGLRYNRKLELSGRTLLIVDSAFAKGNHMLYSFFHVSPLYLVKNENNKVLIYRKESKELVGALDIPHDVRVVVHENDEITHYAEDFGMIDESTVVELQKVFMDKAFSQIKIEF